MFALVKKILNTSLVTKIMLPKMRGFRKYFDETTCMSFLIKNLMNYLKNVKKSWTKSVVLLKKIW